MLANIILLVQFILFANCYNVEVVETDLVPIMGETPHWDVKKNSLYYIDLSSNKTHLYRYDFGEDRTYAAAIEGENGPFSVAGYMIPIEGRKNLFLVGLYHDHKVIEWDGKSPTAKSICTQYTTDADIPYHRVHDTAADPYGNLYGGVSRVVSNDVCAPSTALPGHVYKATKGKQLEIVIKDQPIPNTMVWNLNKSKFYYVESCSHEIYGYDWDPKTTALSGKTVVFNLRKHLNLTDNEPTTELMDGMTIDNDGYLYVAVINSYCIFKIDPETSEVVTKFKFPVPKVQSVAIGGPNLDILFVTTTRFAPDPSTLPKDSGKLFMIRDFGGKGIGGRKLNKSFASCAKQTFIDKVKQKFLHH